MSTQIVWGACTPHAAGMLRHPSGGQREAKDRVFAAFARLRETLQQAQPDALVVVATDHFMTFSYDLMPVFTIGRGERFDSWGEYGSPRARYRGVPDLADALHRAVVTDGFDVAGAVELAVDHAFSCPLSLLDPEGVIPIVPLSVNSFVPPEPALERCVALGRSLHQALVGQQLVERVGVLGTGGISHWIGVPETGRINSGFDEAFLDWFEPLELDELERWNDEYLLTEGGRGSFEIRCWMTAAAAAGASSARRLAYEAVADWITGVSVVELDVQEVPTQEGAEAWPRHT